MKKDRNTFFQSAGMTSQTVMPNMNMMQPMNQPYIYNQMPAPVQASQASQSFYSGPDLPIYNQQIPSNYNDIEARIDQLELQINRLDSRIAKIENQINMNNDNNYSSKMYMV